MPRLKPMGNPWERDGTGAGEEIASPDGGVMVWVPAGEFTMGSTAADIDYTVQQLDASKASKDWLEDCMKAEHPAHQVRLRRGFWLGRCEVTNEQYARFLNEFGNLRDGAGNDLIELSSQYCGVEAGANGYQAKAGRGKHPAVVVTWYGAKAYCDHYGFALPTEAQWEYAARGRQSLRFPWGNDWDAMKCCNGSNKGTGNPPTMEAGNTVAGNSWCGVADMVGNVWEWCADWYDEGYYAESPTEDPTGPASGTGRLLRGGSFYGEPLTCRSACRGRAAPGRRGDNDGFRVARTPWPSVLRSSPL